MIATLQRILTAECKQDHILNIFFAKFLWNSFVENLTKKRLQKQEKNGLFKDNVEEY